MQNVLEFNMELPACSSYCWIEVEPSIEQWPVRVRYRADVTNRRD